MTRQELLTLADNHRDPCAELCGWIAGVLAIPHALDRAELLSERIAALRAELDALVASLAHHEPSRLHQPVFRRVARLLEKLSILVQAGTPERTPRQECELRAPQLVAERRASFERWGFPPAPELPRERERLEPDHD